MPLKKINSDLTVLGEITTNTIVASDGGTTTSVFFTDGTKKDVETWSTLDW